MKTTSVGRKHGFSIVGIGASAGGLEALEELFAGMPADTGMAFVVVTHQLPGHTSLLPELLGRITVLPVVEATDGTTLEPDQVYVSPPGTQLSIVHGKLQRKDTKPGSSPHLPIDYFFHALAQDQKEQAICIILSGMGNDGTQGMKAIRAASGMAMVQEVLSARFPSMPSSAVATGQVDFVLPPASMPEQLVAYSHRPFRVTSPAEPDEALQISSESLQKIFGLLRSRTGHDFSDYKVSTICRRIERRMNLHQLKEPEHYIHYLQENPHEIEILFKELLISVTSFFRDTAAFESLAKTALPELLRGRPDNYTLRIWSPGCATGEEVFSLAILLREDIENAKRHFDVQIFGTDLDSDAIEAARMGLYPDSIAADVSPQRLERFFVREDGSYRIRKDVREMAIFALQNLVKDPPFTKLDLISCRNLLIYLNADLQKRIVPMFHYALKPGGLLFLGPSETIGAFTDLFDVVDKKWKIFRRKESAFATLPAIKFPSEPRKPPLAPRGLRGVRPLKETNMAGLVEKLLLSRFAPASVVVNDSGDVVFIHGRTGAFLEPAAGQPRLNVLEMAREGLQLELASALRQASTQSTEVLREGVRVRENGDFSLINLSIVQISEPEALRGLLLITFQPCTASEKGHAKKDRATKLRESSRAMALERELQSTKESLQTTVEELKSTNEELQSTNEELQSTNEELETSKEEMQSLNEELTTVNAELHSKVDNLSRVNDDMQNLFNSTEIATIFLDRELNIKRYTEQARRLVNLIPTDAGRPIGDLVSSLNYDKLVLDSREVLRTLVFKQAEVQTKAGQWYLMRIMPYRTAENVIDGLVLTFVDINPVKEVQRALHRMSKVFSAGPDPILILDRLGRIVDLNDEAIRTYGFSHEEALGQPIACILPKARKASLEEPLKRCQAGETIRNSESQFVNKDGREISGRMTLSALVDERGEPESMVMIIKQVVP